MFVTLSTAIYVFNVSQLLKGGKKQLWCTSHSSVFRVHLLCPLSQYTDKG